ncbi:MAG TPA: hypothetical protein VF478_07965 [Anaerolineae bacterium]
MRSITDAWNTTRSGEDFIRVLAAKDYYLARGDRRGYVVVDLAGEIHSLSRQIKGTRGKDINARRDANAMLSSRPVQDTLARLGIVIAMRTFSQRRTTKRKVRFR